MVFNGDLLELIKSEVDNYTENSILRVIIVCTDMQKILGKENLNIEFSQQEEVFYILQARDLI